VILADTSVWIDHLRNGNADLTALLDINQVLAHPHVTGELALGNLRRRDLVLGSLDALPQCEVATDEEVRAMIESRALHGKGIGYVDAGLLAGVLLTTSAKLWTLDRRLAAVAVELRIARA
jgi:predicted nucleic acid-binding protein